METTTHIPWAAEGAEMIQSSLHDEIVWRDCSAAAHGLKPTATFGGRSATKDMNQRVPAFPIPVTSRARENTDTRRAAWPTTTCRRDRGDRD